MRAPWTCVVSFLLLSQACRPAEQTELEDTRETGAPDSKAANADSSNDTDSGWSGGGDDDEDDDNGGDASGVTEECPRDPPANVSGDVLEGDLSIASTAEAEAASRWSEVTGTLRVEPAFAGVLELPGLRRVGGSVVVEPTTESPQVRELHLPNVVSVGERVFLYGTAQLVEMDLRNLETVGSVYVNRNQILRRLGLDSLREVVSGVHFSSNPQLTRCELNAICDALGITGCSEFAETICVCEVQCGRVMPRCGTEPAVAPPGSSGFIAAEVDAELVRADANVVAFRDTYYGSGRFRLEGGSPDWTWSIVLKRGAENSCEYAVLTATGSPARTAASYFGGSCDVRVNRWPEDLGDILEGTFTAELGGVGGALHVTAGHFQAPRGSDLLRP